MAKKTGRRARTLQKKKAKVSDRVKDATSRSAARRDGSSAVKAGKRKVLTSKGTTVVGTRDSDDDYEDVSDDEPQVPQTPEQQRSAVLKRHAKERLVLKRHVRTLQDRRSKILRGANAKTERRELGKYMRALQKEQAEKHAREIDAATTAVTGLPAAPMAAPVAPAAPEASGVELQAMFRHLLQ